MAVPRYMVHGTTLTTCFHRNSLYLLPESQLALLLSHMETSRQCGCQPLCVSTCSIPNSIRCHFFPDVYAMDAMLARSVGVTRAATSRRSPCNTRDERWTRPRQTRGRGQEERAQIHHWILPVLLYQLHHPSWPRRRLSSLVAREPAPRAVCSPSLVLHVNRVQPANVILHCSRLESSLTRRVRTPAGVIWVSSHVQEA